MYLEGVAIPVVQGTANDRFWPFADLQISRKQAFERPVLGQADIQLRCLAEVEKNKILYVDRRRQCRYCIGGGSETEFSAMLNNPPAGGYSSTLET